MEQRFLKGRLKSQWLEARRLERLGLPTNPLRQEEKFMKEKKESRQQEPEGGASSPPNGSSGQQIQNQPSYTQGSPHQRRHDSLVETLKKEHGLSQEAAEVWADMA